MCLPRACLLSRAIKHMPLLVPCVCRYRAIALAATAAAAAAAGDGGGGGGADAADAVLRLLLAPLQPYVHPVVVHFRRLRA